MLTQAINAGRGDADDPGEGLTGSVFVSIVSLNSPSNASCVVLRVTISLGETGTPFRQCALSRSHFTVRPVFVVVAAIRSTMTRWLTSGVAFQRASCDWPAG